jgi:signal peptidase
MQSSKLAGQVVEFGLIILVIGLVLGQALGQPILLGFVETGSMEPTMKPNDGFIAIPSPLTGSVGAGDVIVFEAQELHGGGLTTHRVVRTSDRGYITKGDANPFFDQDGEEPPVTDQQIVAEALQINGNVVVIPSLGAAVTTIRQTVLATQRELGFILGVSLFSGTTGMLNLILALCLFAYALIAVTDSQKKQKSRSKTQSRDTGMNTRHVVAVMTVVVVLSVTATMTLPATTHQIPIEGQTGSNTAGSGLAPGETETASVDVPNNGFIPIVVIFDTQTEGIATEPDELYIDGRTVSSAEITVTAPEVEGRVNRVLSERRYLAILPKPLIHALHEVHPWAAILLIDAIIGIPFYLLGVRLIGTGKIRDRSRPSTLSVISRVRRWVSQLY